MNTIYLIRHGENTANLTKEFSYRKIDYSLTPKGVLQSQQTAALLARADMGLDEIYSSPLRRARETAQIIADALGLEVQVIEEFRELNVGSLEGQQPSPQLWLAFRQVIEAWVAGKPETAFPDGENYLQLVARARAGYEQMVRGKEGKRLAIVGHSGIFTMSLPAICPNASIGSLLKNESQNCSVSSIEAELVDGLLQARLIDWSNCDHLSGDAAELVSAGPQ